MVVDKLHLVNITSHVLATQLLRYLLTTLRVGFVGKLCEVAGNRQSKLRHFLGNLSSHRIDQNFGSPSSLVLLYGLLHHLDYIVVETATEAAVAGEHYQRHTLYMCVRDVERCAHVGHGSEKRFQYVLQAVLIRQHVAYEGLGMM